MRAIRREGLDHVIPLSELHLQATLNQFIRHYNLRRPYSSLGPKTPEPPQAKDPPGPHRHRIPTGHNVTSNVVLSELYHEYRLEKSLVRRICGRRRSRRNE